MGQDNQQSSAPRPQASSHSALIWMLTAAKNNFSQASGGSGVPESPGIPEDLEVQQPKSRSAKREE